MNLKPNKHKIISFNKTTLTSLVIGVHHSWNPPPPYLIKGGVGPSKN